MTKQTLRHRFTLNAIALALGSCLAIGALAVRADDPYPPLGADAQKVVDEARAQMRAFDEEQKWLQEDRRVTEAIENGPQEFGALAGRAPDPSDAEAQRRAARYVSEDPMPPLDDAAQRIVDDAREQMYAIDFQRQQERQPVARAESGVIRAQDPQVDTLDPLFDVN